MWRKGSSRDAGNAPDLSVRAQAGEHSVHPGTEVWCLHNPTAKHTDVAAQVIEEDIRTQKGQR